MQSDDEIIDGALLDQPGFAILALVEAILNDEKLRITACYQMCLEKNVFAKKVTPLDLSTAMRIILQSDHVIVSKPLNAITLGDALLDLQHRQDDLQMLFDWFGNRQLMELGKRKLQKPIFAEFKQPYVGNAIDKLIKGEE